MRTIVKLQEPNSLTLHRASTHANYDNYEDKDDLRNNLVKEQRGICCYCMQRIISDPLSMKIEHWKCQDKHKAKQLDYNNLLGACLGGKGQDGKKQHCDTFKGNLDLSKNPANPLDRVENLIHYLGDGTIKSDDPTFDTELNQVLNLNVSFLVNNRKAVLDSFVRILTHKRGTLTAITLKKQLEKWNGDIPGDILEPFCQVIVYWLRKRINRI